jgi:hypothetical protein
MDWVSILGIVSIWIILVPLLIGVILFKRLDADSKLILVVVFLGTVPQVLRPCINSTLTLNVLYNLYTPFEFLIYCMIFKRKLLSPKRQKTLNAIIVLYFIISFLLIFNFGIKQRFLNEWAIANNLLLLIITSLCLLEYYHSDETDINIAQPFFWFIAGMICYASCTSVFFSLWYFIKENPNHQFIILNLIHHIFNILLYIFFSIGFLKNRFNLKRADL